jgi:nucleotide-binding universal stress UspA family protein
MYRTIVVPLDGSPLGERALPYAKSLAHESGTQLILVQALQHPEAGRGGGYEYEAAQAYLGDLAWILTGEGIAATTEVARGEAADVILRAARHRQADVIAMSTHGRSGLGRWLYGSVADAVLRRAETPVLLVPAACDQPWPKRPHAGGKRGSKILVPLDGSELALEALEPAADLAAALGDDLLLLQVAEPPRYPYGEAYAYMPYDPTADLVAGRQYLEGVAAVLRARQLTVDVQTDAGAAAATIAQVAQEQGVDAIAMATHGRSGLARLVLGSVATGVLYQAHHPLLLVSPVGVPNEAPKGPPVEHVETETAAAAAGGN